MDAPGTRPDTADDAPGADSSSIGAAAAGVATLETGKVVLVTGASSGIGAATALRLADEGHLVVLTARRQDRLAELVAQIHGRGGKADLYPLDVTDRAQVTDVVNDVVRRHGRLDVLVANAGVMLLSRLEALLVDQWDQMIDVNVKGLMHAVGAALPHFRAQRSGHLVTIASVGARQVVPTSAVYSATKYAARAFTEGLRLEADPAIRVTTISPGVVASELAEHITDPRAQAMMRTYRRNAIPADVVARAVSYAVGQAVDVDVNEIVLRPAAQR